MIENTRTKVYNFLLNDDDFKKLYLNRKNNYNGFKDIIKDTVEIAFDYDTALYLDKPYLDISWLKLKNKLINLDYLWEIFVERLSA